MGIPSSSGRNKSREKMHRRRKNDGSLSCIVVVFLIVSSTIDMVKIDKINIEGKKINQV